MRRKSQPKARRVRADTSQAGTIRPFTVRIPGAVQLTGISRSRLYELIRDREIETLKEGASTLVVVDSIEKFLQRLRDRQKGSRDQKG